VAKPRKHFWRNTIFGLIVLAPVVGVVVYSSFHVSTYECEVCLSFDGRHVCRKVTGETKEEGLRSGMTNACGILAAGVTDTIACERTIPTKAECQRIEK
jgi:hypothetical protein